MEVRAPLHKTRSGPRLSLPTLCTSSAFRQCVPGSFQLLPRFLGSRKSVDLLEDLKTGSQAHSQVLAFVNHQLETYDERIFLDVYFTSKSVRTYLIAFSKACVLPCTTGAHARSRCLAARPVVFSSPPESGSTV